jgi:DNA/RNA endonuclease YhcR with UshA esterase domain
MRSPAILFALFLWPGLLAADEKPPKPIPPAEAAKKVNEKCTVDWKVQSTGKTRTLVFLNSEENYRDAKNFTVVLFEKAIAGLKKNQIDDPAAYYKGKTIRVTGTVTLYNDRPQIKVEDPQQIRVVEKKDK